MKLLVNLKFDRGNRNVELDIDDSWMTSTETIRNQVIDEVIYTYLKSLEYSFVLKEK